MYAHPTYAVSTSREPLGVLDAWMWARESREADGSRPGVSESLRWIEGYERLAEMAPQLPTTRLVYLADREADIMALMVRARDLGAAGLAAALQAQPHPERGRQTVEPGHGR